MIKSGKCSVYIDLKVTMTIETQSQENFFISFNDIIIERNDI